MRSPPAPQTNFHNKSGFLSQSVTFQGNAASTFDKTRREYVVTEILRTKYREKLFQSIENTNFGELSQSLLSLLKDKRPHGNRADNWSQKRENQIEIKI